MLFQITVYSFASAVVSWSVIYGLLKFGLGRALDGRLQHHHTHVVATPMIGGLGIIVGLWVTYVICFFQLNAVDNKPPLHLAVMGGATGAFLLGLIDDFHPQRARFKLLLQILIAVFAYQCGLSIGSTTLPFIDYFFGPELIGFFLTILWFVFVMNLINLIDGLDGLAGGVGLMLMVLLAYLGIQQNLSFSLIMAVGMIGAILGFLLHNFPPAKCYMGDSGAYLIGYMIAALSLLNSQKGAVIAAIIGPLMALAFPILEATFTLFRRGLRGLPLFRPDRGHIHHLLIKMDFSHRNAVLILYSISLFTLLCGLAVSIEKSRHLPVFLGFAFVVILFVFRDNNISTSSILAFLTDSLQLRREIRNALYLKDWLISEVERADRITYLWSDFQFVLKKIGICRATLNIGEETREFYIPRTLPKDSENLWMESHKIQQYPNLALLTLYGEKENLSKSQFSLLADIATEAWIKASHKWQALNDCPVTFDAVASNPKSYYHRQKSKNLYRPTY